ncbi:ATP-binding protein [Candidatus Woesearchaeota archaeon]|nr:ATP-binding protein [Candidatus Woesearchaeota archaeon]
MKKYIITGGPCTGKTTILNALKEKGYSTVPEAARILIKEQQKNGGIFPWNNLEKFKELVIEKQLELESQAEPNAFLDRSLIDLLAYCPHVENRIRALVKESNYTTAFLLEPLQFYEQDEQRKETKEQARAFHEKTYAAYQKLHIPVIRVPNIGIHERVGFILNHIKNNGGEQYGRVLQRFQQQL